MKLKDIVEIIGGALVFAAAVCVGIAFLSLAA
jgi:hypothetical protein